MASGYSPKEELANALTHGAGAVLSLVGLVLLLIKSLKTGDIWHVVSFSIFGISLVLLFISSTLYHAVKDENKKKTLRKLDHAAIYLLIAGTYTPFLLTNLRGTVGWIMFFIVWAFASVGILVKLLTGIRSKLPSAAIYLVMGWLAVFIYRSMINNLPGISLILLATGGLFYSLGVIFYVWKKLPYHHSIWHIFVLGGGISHYFSIYFLI